MRVLALDHGTARIGCAISDPTGTLADAAADDRAARAAHRRRPGRRARGRARRRRPSPAPERRGGRAGRPRPHLLPANSRRCSRCPVETYDERLTTRMAEASRRDGARAGGLAGRRPPARGLPRRQSTRWSDERRMTDGVARRRSLRRSRRPGGRAAREQRRLQREEKRRDAARAAGERGSAGRRAAARVAASAPGAASPPDSAAARRRRTSGTRIPRRAGPGAGQASTGSELPAEAPPPPRPRARRRPPARGLPGRGPAALAAHAPPPLRGSSARCAGARRRLVPVRPLPALPRRRHGPRRRSRSRRARASAKSPTSSPSDGVVSNATLFQVRVTLAGKRSDLYAGPLRPRPRT